MKVELILDPSARQTEVQIRAPQMSESIQKLCEMLETMDSEPFILSGQRNEKLEIIPPESIIRIYARDGAVYAQTEKGSYRLRQRLYELEDRLNSKDFIRISSSEILALQAVTSFDLSLSGTICVELINGQKSYVSRRYVGTLKKRLGLTGGKKR